jgi:hypothetical protein
MRARLLTCWTEDARDRDLGGPVYRTFIFGATVDRTYPARLVQAERYRRPVSGPELEALQARAAAQNEAFLRAQCAELERLICAEYAHLGFAATSLDARGAV